MAETDELKKEVKRQKDLKKKREEMLKKFQRLRDDLDEINKQILENRPGVRKKFCIELGEEVVAVSGLSAEEKLCEVDSEFKSLKEKILKVIEAWKSAAGMDGSQKLELLQQVAGMEQSLKKTQSDLSAVQKQLSKYDGVDPLKVKVYVNSFEHIARMLGYGDALSKCKGRESYVQVFHSVSNAISGAMKDAAEYNEYKKSKNKEAEGKESENKTATVNVVSEVKEEKSDEHKTGDKK